MMHFLEVGSEKLMLVLVMCYAAFLVLELSLFSTTDAITLSSSEVAIFLIVLARWDITQTLPFTYPFVESIQSRVAEFGLVFLRPPVCFDT